jgi:hypothetical protein
LLTFSVSYKRGTMRVEMTVCMSPFCDIMSRPRRVPDSAPILEFAPTRGDFALRHEMLLARRAHFAVPRSWPLGRVFLSTSAHDRSPALAIRNRERKRQYRSFLPKAEIRSATERRESAQESNSRDGHPARSRAHKRKSPPPRKTSDTFFGGANCVADRKEAPPRPTSSTERLHVCRVRVLK